MKKYTVEYRLQNKDRRWNELIVREQLKWRNHSHYEKYDDMVKAIKDLNKNHNGLFEFRQKIVTQI